MGFEEPALNFWNSRNIGKSEQEIQMKKNGGSVAATVKVLAEPIAQELGYELWDVEYVKEGAEYYLRITIDSPEGITIEDCEKMHRAIDPLLDEADPIEEAYHLEVSSPGIERELKTDMQITACEDWDVEVRLYAPIDGAKSYLGVLKGLNDEGNVVIDCNGTERVFVRSAIASLRTHYEFED